MFSLCGGKEEKDRKKGGERRARKKSGRSEDRKGVEWISVRGGGRVWTGVRGKSMMKGERKRL